MADLLVLRDITDVLARFCRGELAFSDATRLRAQQQLMDLIDHRVFLGRRPQLERVDHVTIQITEVDREYHLTGESEDAQTTVLLVSHSASRERCWQIAESLRLMFTSFTGTFSNRWGTSVCIGGATFDATTELTPETPVDASLDHIFEIQQFLRLTHEVTVLIAGLPNQSATVSNPYTGETLEILSASSFVPGQVELLDLGTGTADGTVTLDNEDGTINYVPESDEHGQRVTVDVRATDTTSRATDTATITWDVDMTPMQIFYGNVIDATEIDLLIAAGWTEGIAAFPETYASASALLSKCATEGIKAHLQFGGSFGTNADIDNLLADANFGSLHSFAFENSITEDQWRYCRNALSTDDQEKLFSYQTQWQGEFNDAAEYKDISNITVSGGGTVTVTATSHGWSNGNRVGIYGVAGMTEINYSSYLIENVTANTFDLTSTNGTGWGAYQATGTPRAFRGTEPSAIAWKQRSRLWYPYAYDEPTYSYDPDETSGGTPPDVQLTVTGITQANPGVVTTSTTHNLFEGQIVTLRGVVGMTEVNDRQFQVTSPSGTTFSLKDENTTGYTAYGSAGTVETDYNGIPKQIAARFDMPAYPLRVTAGWHDDDSTVRRSHYWLQGFGQPMEEKDWVMEHRTAVAPRVFAIYTQLVMAHYHRARSVSFFGYRFAVYNNFHKDATEQGGSPSVSYYSDADNHANSPLTTAEATVYERLMTDLIQAVSDYKSGPGTVPSNSDNAFSFESPLVGVVPGGQSLTRR